VIIRGQEITWASGSLATGAVFNVMALFGLFYLSTILGIEAGVAGLLLFIVRIYDAITDPLMGTISDRTRHRWGARRPYLLLGSLTLGVAFALFFNLPTLNGAAMIAVVLATLILYSTSYTIFAVPYLAMSPDIAPDYDSRTRLMSMRVFFLIVGVLLGSTGGPMLVQAAGDGRRGYAVLGFAIGALVIVGGLVAFFGTRGVKERDSATQLTERRPLLVEAKALYSQVRSVFRFAPFRLLTVVKLLQLAVLALALACTPYFFRFVL
jgi:Na+/melibiose symporter-like transporter